MSRLVKKGSKKAGLPPGVVTYIGKEKTEKVRIKIINYTQTQVTEKIVETVEECLPFKNKQPVTWVDITGIHKTDIIEKMGACFDLHPLVLEDITTTNQRPKLEDFEYYLFIVLQMLAYNEKSKEIEAEQVSLILGNNFVISFQEREGDVFDPVRERIRSGKGKIRMAGSDYLVYSLIDSIVDNYFIILENIGEQIESTEEDLIKNPKRETLNVIHQLKRELIFLRKSVWPLREVISYLQRGDSKLVKKITEVYLKDVYDHTIQIMDTTETFRDLVSGMIDVYLSSISNRMSEVMKVLTMIATIFIPLSFIVGIYGMNFRYMPELYSVWGYPLVMLFMIIIAVFMLRYFRKKNWM